MSSDAPRSATSGTASHPRPPRPASQPSPPSMAAPTLFREVLGRFATGVTVVAALEEGVPVGFTCQAFASLSLDPAMVVLAPAKASTSWPRMATAGAFCVNILTDEQRHISETFAEPRPDRFADVPWHVGPAGTPVIDGALAWVECELGTIHDAGDHELVTGRVLELGIGSGSPLIFYRSGYGHFHVS
jgi:3-hydroxy-9,10-secoandrosta-1,3,5(10)-triene-9,17-dione monooxygenase reductase component